jgi:hypothetical protein
MDGAVEAGERAGFEVASRIALAAAERDGGVTRDVVPPEHPGTEPMNQKVLPPLPALCIRW